MTDFPNWFNVTAKANFELVFVKKLKTDKKLRGLQIGTYTGDATEWLMKNTKMSLIDVDTWGGSEEVSHEDINFNEVEAYYDSRHADNPRVTKYKGTSDSFFAQYEGEPFDFIYIDGDHTASQTAIDGLQALKVLKPGGIIAFDDLTWQSGKGPYYDPKPGIDAVFHIGQSILENFIANSQAWFTKK
jgi:hypothetical protein